MGSNILALKLYNFISVERTKSVQMHMKSVFNKKEKQIRKKHDLSAIISMVKDITFCVLINHFA